MMRITSYRRGEEGVLANGDTGISRLDMACDFLILDSPRRVGRRVSHVITFQQIVSLSPWSGAHYHMG